MEKYVKGKATFTIHGTPGYEEVCRLKSGEKRNNSVYLFHFTDMGYGYRIRIQKSESGKKWLGVYRRITPPPLSRSRVEHEEHKEQLDNITVNDRMDHVEIEATWLEDTYDYHLVIEATK